jgi:hypothetical protein
MEEEDQNQEQFKKLHYRMYENKFPKENDLVFVSLNFSFILIVQNSRNSRNRSLCLSSRV